MKQAQRLRRDMLSQHLSEKSKASAKIKAKRKAEVEARRAERWLVAQSRQENAERVRREKEFHQKQVMQKIHQAYKMMDHMKELRAAVVEERKKVKRQMIIEVDEWKDKTTLQRNITPGPGEYESHRKLPGPSGGTWGKYAPKSDLEWIIYRASQLPGPGQYEDVDQTKLVTGGTWGKYAPKSDVEWQIYRASQIPGPGDYEPAEVPSGAAVTFGEFDPKSDLDVLIARASQLPGPSDYAPPMPPIKKPSIKAMRSKLRKAAEKVKMANTFISMAKGAARDRRASMAKGVRVPFTVKSSDVRQTQRMLDAHDARREAEDAAERGDVQGAKRAADKATLAAQSAQRAAMGTGGQVGVVQNPQAVAAARSASSAAKVRCCDMCVCVCVYCACFLPAPWAMVCFQFAVWLGVVACSADKECGVLLRLLPSGGSPSKPDCGRQRCHGCCRRRCCSSLTRRVIGSQERGRGRRVASVRVLCGGGLRGVGRAKQVTSSLHPPNAHRVISVVARAQRVFFVSV